jgi:hypothetical protein
MRLRVEPTGGTGGFPEGRKANLCSPLDEQIASNLLSC